MTKVLDEYSIEFNFYLYHIKTFYDDDNIKNKLCLKLDIEEYENESLITFNCQKGRLNAHKFISATFGGKSIREIERMKNKTNYYRCFETKAFFKSRDGAKKFIEVLQKISNENLTDRVMDRIVD